MLQRLFVLAVLLASPSLWAQCQLTFALSATARSAVFDNRTLQCSNWTLTYTIAGTAATFNVETRDFVQGNWAQMTGSSVYSAASETVVLSDSPASAYISIVRTSPGSGLVSGTLVGTNSAGGGSGGGIQGPQGPPGATGPQGPAGTQPFTDDGTTIFAPAGRNVVLGTTCPGGDTDSVCIGGKFRGDGSQLLNLPAGLPTQTAHTGEYLTTNGSVASWASAVPASVPKCSKYTIAYTALTAAAAAQNVVAFNVPARGKLVGLTVKEGTQFACSGGCTGITTMTVSLGRTGTETEYLATWPIMQSVADGNQTDTGGHFSAIWTAHDVQAKFVVTNGTPGNLGNGSATNLIAGSLDIWACVVVLP